MQLNLELARFWTIELVTFSLLIQSLELLSLRQTWSDRGVWAWSAVRLDYESSWFPLRKSLDFVFKERFYFLMLCLRLGLVCLWLTDPATNLAIAVLVLTLLNNLRWRGAFNGGSDYMTVVVLSGLSLDYIFRHHPSLQPIGLWYIGIQSLSSYFVAGLAKLNQKEWRAGRALSAALGFSPLPKNEHLAEFLANSQHKVFLSWAVILAEILAIFVLFQSSFSLLFLPAMFLFHLLNYRIFGLNRFVWAWLATYPAILFVSGVLG